MNSIMSRLVRIGLIVLALLVATLLVLYMIGGNSHNYAASIQIKVPPEVVFQYLSDPTTEPQWMSDVERVDPLTTGQYTTGSKSRLTVNKNGRRIEITDEVLEAVPNESILLASKTPEAQVRTAFRLQESSPGRTVVTLTVIVTPTGLSRLVCPADAKRFGAPSGRRLG